MKHKSWDGLECQTRIRMWGTDRYVWGPFWLRWEPLGRRGGGPSSQGLLSHWTLVPFFYLPLNFFCAGILKLALGAALDMVEGVVCGAVGAGCWGLWRGCWAGVSGVPWGWVLGAAEGAIGGVVGVPQGEGAGGRGGGVWWGGTGRRGGGCWGLRWARWRRSAGAVGVGAGGRGEGGGGGQRGAVGVGAGSRGEAGRVRQTASINTPGPPPHRWGIFVLPPHKSHYELEWIFWFQRGAEGLRALGWGNDITASAGVAVINYRCWDARPINTVPGPGFHACHTLVGSVKTLKNLCSEGGRDDSTWTENYAISHAW